MPVYAIGAFYQFFPFPTFRDWRQPLQQFCEEHHLSGTLLVAAEGFNGTVSGTDSDLSALFEILASLPGAGPVEVKWSQANRRPFYRMKVRLKKEIVTIGDPSISPIHGVGTYIEPQDWNALISDPEVTVIDTRNAYEVRVGKFKGAIDPQTESFREFPNYVDTHLDPAKTPRVAMYCTGGIRCEKATALMKQRGFQEVYHLKGGILKYLEMIDPAESTWEGECFVFDQRVSVIHGLQTGSLVLCGGCRAPLTREEQQDPRYERGVSCPWCHAQLTPDQRDSARERQHQIDLAAQRGHHHLGSCPATEATNHNRHHQVRECGGPAISKSTGSGKGSTTAK